jgi:DNA-directed RNA polymerase specialized sigma24 family protein
MATHDTRARLVRAVRDTERAERRRDLILVEAHAEGMSYGELARVTGWDRRSLTRHLDRVRARFMAELEDARQVGVVYGAEAWDFLGAHAERAKGDNRGA